MPGVPHHPGVRGGISRAAQVKAHQTQIKMEDPSAESGLQPTGRNVFTVKPSNYHHLKDIFRKSHCSSTKEDGEDGGGEKVNFQTGRHIICGLKGGNVIDLLEDNTILGPL